MTTTTLNLQELQATYEARRRQFAGDPNKAVLNETISDLLEVLGELRAVQTDLAAARTQVEVHHRYIAALNGGRGCRLHACQTSPGGTT
jgi:hypothetical protein